MRCLRAAARDEETALLRELGFTSAIVVPMIARGKTLGAISPSRPSLVASTMRRTWILRMSLPQAALLAVDNAKL